MTERVSTDMAALQVHFRDLQDPRSTTNRHHLLGDIILICIAAILAGADGPEGIARWAKSSSVSEWLKQRLLLPHGIPSKDTYRRVLQRLNPMAFQRGFESWMQTLIGGQEIKLMAIDGKTMRRSHDKRRGLGAMHLVSVWASDLHLTLGQVATAEKSNEITAIPEVLDLVDISGAVVTIDAMGTQKAIAAKIIEGHGDYILPVKGNQGTLEAAVVEIFDRHLENDFANVEVSQHETEEKRHGRLEKRTYFQIDVPKDLPACHDWVAMKTLGMVIRTREVDGQEMGEVQCYIGSVKRDVGVFARAVRSHWGIENTCHWTLDMTFREDESRTRDRHVGQNLAWIRRFVVGLLKRHPDTKTSLAMKRRQAGWSLDFLAEVLCGATT